MQNHNGCTLKTHRFEFPGSTAHYPLLLSFILEHMLLKIKPDFDSNTLKDCEQKLRSTALKDINEIKLDIAELDVRQVTSSSFSSDIDTVILIQREPLHQLLLDAFFLIFSADSIFKSSNRLRFGYLYYHRIKLFCVVYIAFRYSE